jgi:hypothetical protein
MGDDWVKKYLGSWSQDSQRREAELRRAQLVESGSAQFFAELRARIGKDLATFQAQVNDPHLIYLQEAEAFSLTRNAFPMVKLAVTLSGPTIQYTRSSRIDRSQADFGEEDTGQISLVSDLDGNIQGRANGDLLKDYSEMSEFLLTPVFDYLREHH